MAMPASEARARPVPVAGFFAGLPPLASQQATFDDAAYRSAPDDWALAVTDIVGSTRAIAAGRH